MNCLFCHTSACTCADTIYQRYLYLENYLSDLIHFSLRNKLSIAEKKIWRMMFDQANEEKIKLKKRLQ
jgi:hypothetical protein